MKIKEPSKWEMYCPYCDTDLIIDKKDFYTKSIPCKEVKGWNFLQKLVAGLKKTFTVECVKCCNCNKEIQLKEETDEWYNYPIWVIDHKIADEELKK